MSIPFFIHIFYIYYFITSLHNWETVQIHRPWSIYNLSFIFPVFSGSMTTIWFCGHCSFGPMMIETTEFCMVCHRQRDFYATYGCPEPPFTASSNQHEPQSSAAHCGNRVLIVSRTQTGARGQETSCPGKDVDTDEIVLLSWKKGQKPISLLFFQSCLLTLIVMVQGT